MTDEKKRRFRAAPTGETEVELEDGASPDPRTEALADASFSTHILSLNATALYHLGLFQEEGGPAPEPEGARHIIDTLAMLKQKTAGNLTVEEENLLSSCLTDLRLLYVRQR